MNPLLTRLILAFVGLSCLALLLPLKGMAWLGLTTTLVERDQSLAVYAAMLLLFFTFIAPGAMAKAPIRGGAWTGVTLILLLFASIPMVFTAYISGVSAHGLVCVAFVVGAWVGLPLLMLRLGWGARLPLLMGVLGAILLFAIPATHVYLQSVEREGLGSVVRWSPWTHLRELVHLRRQPPIWPYALALALVWAYPVLRAILRLWNLARPTGRALSNVTLGVLVASTLAVLPSAQEPRLQSLSGGVARPGFHTGLRVQPPDTHHRYVLKSSLDAVLLPEGAIECDVALAVGERDHQLTLSTMDGDQSFSLDAPFRIDEQNSRLVAALLSPTDWRAHGDALRRFAPHCTWIDASQFDCARLAPALAGFDVVVVWGDGPYLETPRKDALSHYAAMGGVLIILGNGLHDAGDPAFGEGLVVARSPEGMPLEEMDIPVSQPRGSVLHREVVQTFAPPDWQELDLSQLFWFALIYHLLVLVVFLLPLLLDSRKAMGVYLVSVAFVTLLVAGVAWHVLGEIFLRDNQVYTQGLTVIAGAPQPGQRWTLRQFLCFASMSGEERDLVIPGAAGATIYNLEGEERAVLREIGGSDLQLRRVPLNRHGKKQVIRLDRDIPSLLRVEERQGSFTLIWDESVPDPQGLRTTQVQGAIMVEGGEWGQAYKVSGDRLLPTGEDVPPAQLGPGFQLLLRRLVGHFAPRFDRYLLVQLDGLPRPDDQGAYFLSRDLGAFLVLNLDS